MHEANEATAMVTFVASENI